MAMAKKTVIILERALELIESVPYKVSLRWVFYQLLQAGIYGAKNDYMKWKALASRYRKNFEFGFNPTTLADDTRARVNRSGGARNLADCLSSLVSDTVDSISFHLDHFYQQDHYVELWFEAKAMAGQFKHYTRGIDLIPFGGDPSIPFKWEIAKELERNERYYDKPIVVLYFGDHDKHGLEILDSAEADVRSWSNADFELVRCGLTPDQVDKYGVPENPAKPGEYQWEALTDAAAREIINDSLSEYIDVDLIDTVNNEASIAEDEWRDKVETVLTELIEDEGI